MSSGPVGQAVKCPCLRKMLDTLRVPTHGATASRSEPVGNQYLESTSQEKSLLPDNGEPEPGVQNSSALSPVSLSGTP